MTEQALIKRIDALEIQVAELRGLRIVKPESGKKVNVAAFRKAMDAWVKGNDRGKALREYRKFYKVPGT